MEINKKDIGVKLKQFTGTWFVYYIYLGESCIYIGSSKNLYKRLKEHKYQKTFDSVRLVKMDSEYKAKTFERLEIFRIQPELNVWCRDSFRPPSVKNNNSNMKEKRDAIKLLNR
ncbi:MAG TPA: GIY-YIG nuclease family protein [Bacteroidales bacterium]|nr:GIY-YIG nuclease family protein [Bacteroidales bacterium]